VAFRFSIWKLLIALSAKALARFGKFFGECRMGQLMKASMQSVVAWSPLMEMIQRILVLNVAGKSFPIHRKVTLGNLSDML
jgi:hypothetical protein